MIRDPKASDVGTGRRFPSILVGATLTLALLQGQPAQARTFNVPCDDAALLAALATVETNGEEDVLWLAESCTYTLDSPWIVDHDGGTPEGFAVNVHGRDTTISGSGQHPVFFVYPAAVLSLHGVTVRDGASPEDGGAIQNIGALTLTDSTVSHSQGRQGGGIRNFVNGRVTLVRSSVAANHATYYGGGIYNEGRLTLIDSTVSGNSSASDIYSNGGGIYSYGARARVTLTNSTVSGNSSRFGAGVFNDEGALVVKESTIAGNTALGGGNGAGIYHRSYSGTAIVKIGNTIVADGLFEQGNGYECVRDPVNAFVIASGVNLVEDGSCAIEGALSGDPLLGAPTGNPAHYPLLPGSPAIDVGGLYDCAGTDQRGQPRPRDGNQDSGATCDLGAFELQ